jgi:hypothetical protein
MQERDAMELVLDLRDDERGFREHLRTGEGLPGSRSQSETYITSS